MMDDRWSAPRLDNSEPGGREPRRGQKVTAESELGSF